MKLRNQNDTKIIRNYVITAFLFLCSVAGFSQSLKTNGMVIKEVTKVENIAITVTADSAKDLESTFKIKDLKDVLEDSDDNESISLKIVCNGKKMSNGKKSHVSYKIEGNSDDSDSFIKSAELLRMVAIKYFNYKK